MLWVDNVLVAFVQLGATLKRAGGCDYKDNGSRPLDLWREAIVCITQQYHQRPITSCNDYKRSQLVCKCHI